MPKKRINAKQYDKLLKNLRKARKVKSENEMVKKVVGMGAMRHMMRRGGFNPASLLGLASQGHALLQKYRPVSALGSFIKDSGVKVPDNVFTRGAKSIGNFLIDKLGYGRRRRRARR